MKPRRVRGGFELPRTVDLRLVLVVLLSLCGVVFAQGNPNTPIVASVDKNLSSSVSGLVTIRLTIPSLPMGSPYEEPGTFVIHWRALVDGDIAPSNNEPDAAFLYHNNYGYNPATYILNTSRLHNGNHVLHIWVQNAYFPYTYYGSWVQNISVQNGRLPLSLRTNYRTLYLTPGQNASLAAFLFYTNGDTTPVLANYSSDNVSIATVTAQGFVRAGLVGDTDILVTSQTRSVIVRVIVNAENNSPHFGTDGSVLLSYDPSRSSFVRSMFFLWGDLLKGVPHLSEDFAQAKLTAIEHGLYTSPAGVSQSTWMSIVDGRMAALRDIADAYNVSILFTGDEIARGDFYTYESSRGASAAWVPNPLEYVFTAARNLGRTIGVEMVDEISFMYGPTPFPEGRLGRPGGPQRISCRNDYCTVFWPQWAIGERFLITGITSDPDLNRDIQHFYTIADRSRPDEFTFWASNISTRDFDIVTDPNAVLEIFPYSGRGANELDYTRNDAFRVIMSFINRVANRPMVTWPVAGDHGPRAVQNWVGDPSIADYATIYWSIDRSLPRGQPSLVDALTTYRRTFDKFGVVQRDKPILFLAPASGPMYRVRGISVPIHSFTNATIVFAAPHGIPLAATLPNPVPRITVYNNSNPLLNGDYYVAATPNTTIARVYRKLSPIKGGWAFGGTATFEDGSTKPVWAMEYSGAAGTVQFGGGYNTTNNTHVLNTRVTVSGSPTTAFNRVWYIWGTDFGGLLVRFLPDEQEQGANGTGAIVSTNDYIEGVSDLIIEGSTPEVISASAMWSAAAGAAGNRYYHYGGALDRPLAWNEDNYFDLDPKAPADGLQPGSNPRANGGQSTARWQAMHLANNLITYIEPYLFAPKTHAPDFGSRFMTAARSSTRGAMLMLISFSDIPVTEYVNLSTYATSAPGTLYRLTSHSLSSSPFVQTGALITFEPGETIVFTFPANSSASMRRIVLRLEGAPAIAANGTLAFLAPGSANVLAQIPLTTDLSGGFNFTVPPNLPSLVDLRVTLPGYLRRTYQSAYVSDSPSSPSSFEIPELLAGEFNGDGAINSLDWSVMNRAWFNTHPHADINRDGIVNSLDFSFISKNWLQRDG